MGERKEKRNFRHHCQKVDDREVVGLKTKHGLPTCRRLVPDLPPLFHFYRHEVENHVQLFADLLDEQDDKDIDPVRYAPILWDNEYFFKEDGNDWTKRMDRENPSKRRERHRIISVMEADERYNRLGRSGLPPPNAHLLAKEKKKLAEGGHSGASQPVKNAIERTEIDTRKREEVTNFADSVVDVAAKQRNPQTDEHGMIPSDQVVPSLDVSESVPPQMEAFTNPPSALPSSTRHKRGGGIGESRYPGTAEMKRTQKKSARVPSVRGYPRPFLDNKIEGKIPEIERPSHPLPVTDATSGTEEHREDKGRNDDLATDLADSVVAASTNENPQTQTDQHGMIPWDQVVPSRRMPQSVPTRVDGPVSPPIASTSSRQNLGKHGKPRFPGILEMKRTEKKSTTARVPSVRGPALRFLESKMEEKITEIERPSHSFQVQESQQSAQGNESVPPSPASVPLPNINIPSGPYPILEINLHFTQFEDEEEDYKPPSLLDNLMIYKTREEI